MYDLICISRHETKSEKNCKLPFIYKGMTYEKCPVDPIDPKETWCSINIDSNGIHVNGRKNYEFCSDNCPKYDFSDFDNGFSILPTGQSGVFKSPHYTDQTLLYNKGEFKSFKFSESVIKDDTKMRKLIFVK